MIITDGDHGLLVHRVEGHAVDDIVVAVGGQLAAVDLVPDVDSTVLTTRGHQGITGVQVNIEGPQRIRESLVTSEANIQEGERL